MLKRVPLSLPHLVTVLLNIHFRAPFLEVEANIAGLTCSSPCEQSDASGTSGIALPPCTVSTTRSCETDDNVPVLQAPGSPQHSRMELSDYVGPDSDMYLELTPHWQPSTDRIHRTTGYEVKVKCQHSICAETSFCVSILFNGTLTDDNVDSNFSVTCQSGDFAQPGMGYTTIIRSLPNSNDNSNEQRFLTTMPSCEPESNLTACIHQRPEEWMPQYRPQISQLSNGSVKVLFMAKPNYAKYDVGLYTVGGGSYTEYYKTYVYSPGDVFPSLLFDDVKSGVYRAYLRIHEDLCDDCGMIRSASTFTVTEINECDSSPCLNSGTCSTQVNGYLCDCLDGFNGTRCEIKIDECDSSPCQNSGNCIDQVNGYLCDCSDGFIGTHCEIKIDECDSSPCQNSGTCSTQVNGYLCDCSDGFIGTHCEITMPSLAPSASPRPASTSAKSDGNPLFTILYVFLGVIVLLIVLVIARIYRRSPPPPSKSSSPEIEIGSELAQSAFPHCGTSCGDLDSLNGTAYVNQFPLLNGTVQSDYPTCKFTSASMAAATIHHDNLTNGRLLKESQCYADSMASEQGDSISKIMDIHHAMGHQTSSKCGQPESPDSGLESTHEDMKDDGFTVLSLNLPDYGDPV